MKPQLRGRIRRNIVTLLELGADVTVLTVGGNHDFFVGLDHPRLRAEFLPARSVYVRFAEHAARRSRERAARRAAGAAPRATGTRPLEDLRDGPLYLVGGALFLAQRLGRTAARLAVGGRAAAADWLLPSRVWRRLPARARQVGWAAARWWVRARRRVRLLWLRRLRPRLLTLLVGIGRPGSRLSAAISRLGGPGMDNVGRDRSSATGWQRSFRRRRLLFRRAFVRRLRNTRKILINRRQAIRRSAIRRGKDILRPWHRTTRFLAFWRESADRIAELAPDMVVSSDLPGLVGAGRAARRFRLPHLHDCHELYLESLSFRSSERRILAPIERRYLRRANSVVAVNASIATEYGRRYGRTPAVVRNCAARLSEDPQPRDLRTVAGLPSGSRIALYQGGFSAGRGLEVCVAAVAMLPADVHLVLLGYGPLRGDLMVWAHQCGVVDRVHVLDAVPPEELLSYTVSATAGLLPYQPVSRNNLLTLPNKIFEYTAVGVPIVVSDLPELRRIAVDGGCGRVYDPFDASSLASALSDVLGPSNPSYRDAARAYGRANAWENEREILVGEILRISPELTRAQQKLSDLSRPRK